MCVFHNNTAGCTLSNIRTMSTSSPWIMDTRKVWPQTNNERETVTTVRALLVSLDSLININYY